ncbi:MAG: DUF1501 domain-containing protein [Planctomycetota bacterium]|nr:DUF1501 domain-containing protein [Planctomycetota bacterium]
MHCGNYQRTPLSRREMLRQCSSGFGAVALSALLCDPAFGAPRATRSPRSSRSSRGLRPFAPRASHFRPRARSVILLYMDGGVSQVDSFDPKPRLDRDHGRKFSAKIEPTQFNNIGKTLKSPWGFKNYGRSGIPVSDLFPHVGGCIDDICVIRSMVSNFSEHQTANFFLHTGSGMQGRPSMGAWIGYGLGSECRDLPGYIVINGGLIPSGGLDNFGTGFLPAAYQGTIFKPGEKPIANIQPREKTPGLQRRKLGLLERLDRGVVDRFGRVDALESSIANYELAYRMQVAVPGLVELQGESEATRKLYGLDAPYGPTRSFATQCLIARRMVERGVRFVELTCPRIGGNDRWDAHGNLRKNHSENSRAVDQPIAGLLKDLKCRGLLDETLVVWAGEFGRTPFAQGNDGRDHSPFGFTIWLAGGGVKGGTVHGETDEYGYKVVREKVDIHDLHATILHLLGMDHKKLTFRFSGRDMRLTDVHGNVVQGILA